MQNRYLKIADVHKYFMVAFVAIVQKSGKILKLGSIGGKLYAMLYESYAYRLQQVWLYGMFERSGRLSCELRKMA